jgi:protein-L-isoaspartate(D-aspartate) O-methyltransferase
VKLLSASFPSLDSLPSLASRDTPEEEENLPMGEDEELVAFLLSLRSKGVRDKELLKAFENVPRALFMEARHADLARKNMALPIACGQTLLAPSVIARLISALELKPDHSVLEIGTGTGYATALLARLAKTVISFERFHTLALGAAQRLPQLHISNVELYHADGLEAGHEIAGDENAENEREGVDRIVLMGAVADVPENLLLALKPKGRLVGVVLEDGQPLLTIIDRHESGEFSLKQEESLALPLLIAGVAQAL